MARFAIQIAVATLLLLLGLVSAAPLLDRQDVRVQYKAADQCIFLLDFDGILTQKQKDHPGKNVHSEAVRTVKKLSDNKKNIVWIVNARRPDPFVKYLYSHYPRLGLAADHGGWIRWPGDATWEEDEQSIGRVATLADKDRVVTWLLEKYQPAPAFVFAAGNKFVDEGMFEAVNAYDRPGYFTVAVGRAEKRTAAKFSLPTPQDVLATIKSLA